jgi:hypothetical protein
VNERAQQLENRFEPWYLVAALLVIPDVAIEATTQSHGWSNVALVLNWAVWLVFAIGLISTAALATGAGGGCVRRSMLRSSCSHHPSPRRPSWDSGSRASYGSCGSYDLHVPPA